MDIAAAGLERWPSVVEIEVNSRCNRSCSYCPNGLPDRPALQNFMSIPLYERIITELAEINYCGRLSFHFFNEPLLRKDLASLIATARTQLPLAFIVLYTNGDLLDDARYDSLLAAGVDQFLVTRHSWDALPERAFQVVQYPSNFTISGRGGSVAMAQEPLDLPCHGPAEMMIVTINGDVVLCHEDADREERMGNFREQSLHEIWFAPRFKEIRATLTSGRRADATALCRRCDNRLYPIPGGAI